MPDAELFSIRMHYTIDGIEGLAGYVDFCSADQMSRIELLSMAKEFNLNVDLCSIWWLDSFTEFKAMREIKNDMDALLMAQSVNSTREVLVCVKISGGANAGVFDEHVDGDSDLEARLLNKGKDKKHSHDEEGSEIHDSEWSFTDELDGQDGEAQTEIVPVSGKPTNFESNDDGMESDYAGSEELHSCSSTDEDELESKKPSYSEFNEECDMKDPHFKIGMKFRSFKQFKEAVKNYGIKHRFVMNFRPNDKDRCRAFCKRGCPFYLWASPMLKDKATVQIKSGYLNHECTRDHNNRHVSADWIAKAYLEQFRADPSWKIAGIIQAVKTNQEVQISRLTAYRAKCIALR